MPSDVRSGLRSGRDVFARALEAFLPPDVMTVAAFAAAYRWLNNPGVNVGRWQHSETPYLVEPMESLTSTSHLATAIVGPARSGKTSVAENWLLYSVGSDPAHLLWYMPTEPVLTSYVKQVINPMIDLHTVMKSRLGARPVDDSLSFKNFRGMTAQFLTVAYANLISKTASRLVLDEIDAYPENLGDVYALADLRRQAAGTASMILAVSHPDRARGMAEEGWQGGIMKLYASSDRRVWYWACPHCGAFSSPCPTAARVMALDYPQDAPLDVIEREAALVCPTCSAHIEDRYRRSMNETGRWVASGQTIDEDGRIEGEAIASKMSGYWIVGVMSPFIIGGIGALARANEAAKRAYVANPTEEALRAWKDVVVKRLGLPFELPRKASQLDATAIADRAEPGFRRGTVPAGVRFITVAVDVQPTRFEIMARGWGERGESWVIEHIRQVADTSISPDDWDSLFEQLTALSYPLADGSGRRMAVRAVGCDSGGAAGATSQAYAAWLRARKRQQARLAGRVDGREAWTLLLLKGASGPNAPTLAVSYPDSVRKDRTAAARGQIPVGLFAPNRFKDDLASQLANAEAGPGFVHIPASFRSAQAPHAYFEQLVAEVRRPDGRWVKATPTARNEWLDLMVMTHAMAHLWGLPRIDWQAPPAWAGPWDENPLVTLPEIVVEEEADGPVVVAKAPPPAPVGKRRSIADLWS
ncbi:MAG: terminase gpA endonuclease subunit [Janthinobacterium lividum]